MTDSIPKEHLQQWLNDPLTKQVFKVLSKVREQLQTALIDGQTLNTSSTETTAMNTALLLGKISGLNTILEITIDEEE